MDFFGDSTTSVEWYKCGLRAGNGQDDRMRFQKSKTFSTAANIDSIERIKFKNRNASRLIKGIVMRLIG